MKFIAGVPTLTTIYRLRTNLPILCRTLLTQHQKETLIDYQLVWSNLNDDLGGIRAWAFVSARNTAGGEDISQTLRTFDPTFISRLFTIGLYTLREHHYDLDEYVQAEAKNMKLSAT
jgi:hypothetical protein